MAAAPLSTTVSSSSTSTLPSGATAAPIAAPHVFTPLTIRSLTLRNRICVSPMCQYRSRDGFMNDYHMQHLGRFARGGAGLIIMEATGVHPTGRITPACAGLWKDDHIAPMKAIIDYCHTQGAAVGIQLAHAGRKASTAAVSNHDGLAHESDGGCWHVIGPKDVVGPSTIPWDSHHWPPRALTKEEIKEVIGHFVAATQRAERAGFDMIELHGAHGYLISSFGSPLANNRTDEYGGSLANRCRFAIEVATAVRAVWPTHKPLAMRLSCSDWVEGGWTSSDSVYLSRELQRVGIDIVDCSSGAQSPLQRIITPPEGADLYQVPFAIAVKNGVPGLLSAAVGMIQTPEQAEHIITAGKADLVMVARQFLREPDFPLRCAMSLGIDMKTITPISPPMWNASKESIDKVSTIVASAIPPTKSNATTTMSSVAPAKSASSSSVSVGATPRA